MVKSCSSGVLDVAVKYNKSNTLPRFISTVPSVRQSKQAKLSKLDKGLKYSPCLEVVKPKPFLAKKSFVYNQNSLVKFGNESKFSGPLSTGPVSSGPLVLLSRDQLMKISVSERNNKNEKPNVEDSQINSLSKMWNMKSERTQIYPPTTFIHCKEGSEVTQEWKVHKEKSLKGDKSNEEVIDVKPKTFTLDLNVNNTFTQIKRNKTWLQTGNQFNRLHPRESNSDLLAHTKKTDVEKGVGNFKFVNLDR